MIIFFRISIPYLTSFSLQKNELVIGTLNGELLIYKNDCKNPQASTKDLGMVACILVGDILNVGSVSESN